MILFERCLVAAALIVDSYRGPCEAYNFDVGGSDSSGSSKFSRVGTSATSKEFTLPTDLAALIEQSYTGSAVDDTTSANVLAVLNQILQQNSGAVPGLSALTETANIDAANYGGRPALDNITARNPYSQDYESAIEELYNRMFGQGRALAQSGPTNVRGGTARQGFELAEMDAAIGRNKFKDIRQQQDREAGVVSEAVRTAETIESMRRGTKLQGQQQHMAGESARKGEALNAAGAVGDMRRNHSSSIALAADALGKPTQTTRDNLSGRGTQATQSSNWGVGLSCCFIFLQALNGTLPWYVRRGRDEFNTPARRAGYVWMSHWLVPLMQKSRLASSLVNALIIKPFLLVGYWHYADRRRNPVLGPVLKPYCWTWFWVWSLLGTLYGNKCELVRQT